MFVLACVRACASGPPAPRPPLSACARSRVRGTPLQRAACELCLEADEREAMTSEEMAQREGEARRDTSLVLGWGTRSAQEAEAAALDEERSRRAAARAGAVAARDSARAAWLEERAAFLDAWEAAASAPPPPSLPPRDEDRPPRPESASRIGYADGGRASWHLALPPPGEEEEEAELSSLGAGVPQEGTVLDGPLVPPDTDAESAAAAAAAVAAAGAAALIALSEQPSPPTAPTATAEAVADAVVQRLLREPAAPGRRGPVTPRAGALELFGGNTEWKGAARMSGRRMELCVRASAARGVRLVQGRVWAVTPRCSE